MSKASAPIIVPLDGSKISEAALPLAARLSAIFNAPIQFVHVLHGEQVNGPEELQAAESTFRSYVDSLVAAHGAAPDGYEAVIRTGSPAVEILKLAEDARFVAIASHGRGGLKAAVIGSVADKVVRGARVPLFLVPIATAPRPPIDGPVLVALDGSDEGEAGLSLARRLGQEFGIRILLVRAYNMPPTVGMEFAPYPADFLGNLEKDAEDYLRRTVVAGEEALCIRSTAPEGIAQVADERKAGLVVVASHGKGFAARMAMGSTTDRLIHMLKRPMLIAPIGVEPADAG